MENHKKYLEIAPGKQGYHVNEKRVMGSNHSLANAVEIARYLSRQVERGYQIEYTLSNRLKTRDRKRIKEEIERLNLENLVYTENI